MISSKILSRLVVLTALFVLFGRSEAMSAFNSYIYLPDKFIQEEIAIGSLIVDVSEELNNYMQQRKEQQQQQQDSAAEQKDSESENSEVQHFTFLEDTKSSTENTYFILDSITGRVTSKRYLDRESMCINKHCMDTCDLGNPNAVIINNKNIYSSYYSPAEASSNNNKTAGGLGDQANALNPSSGTKGNCKMNLKILVIPSYSIVSMNVIVQDINDNKPQFSIEHMVQTVPENVPVGYNIPIDLAYDPDVGINAIQYYSLIQISASNPSSASSASADFIRDVFELVQNEQQLSLVVKRKLDREKVSQYNITIAACDGGSGTPSTCGQLKLILNVADINDHSPVFMKDTYRFEVAENTPSGTLIGQVSAFDLDEGLNGKIKYSIMSVSNTAGANVILEARPEAAKGDQNGLLKYFDLDVDSGTIKLNVPLDYEKERHLTLNIEARDCGIGSLPAYATIEIFVIDVNDNAPEISVSFLNSFFRNSTAEATRQDDLASINNSKNVSAINIYMNENAAPNKFIAHVSISDRDSADNAKLDWKVLVNQVEINLPSVSPNEKLHTDQQLLKISKLNSNSFTINTGSMSHKSFDRELMGTINVSIVAWDYGQMPPRSSNLAYYNFSIVLLDENDNAPKFDRPLLELEVHENNQLDELIHTLAAKDADLDENGRVTYSLELAPSDQSKPFVYVDSLTGALRAGKVFDREDKAAYEFSVIATDSGKEKRLSTKVKCLLRVLDVNDNKPRIFFNSTALPYREYSNRSHLFLRLDENLPVTTQLARFNCDDADSSENGKAYFKIIRNVNELLSPDWRFDDADASGEAVVSTFAEQLPFKVTDDGRLLVSKKLDRELLDIYEFVVVCHDLSRNHYERLNTTLNVVIRLNDVNDNCPRNTPSSGQSTESAKVKFINKQNPAPFKTKSKDQLTLFELSYSDADAGKNAELKFELLSHTDLFELKVVAEPAVASLSSSSPVYKLQINLQSLRLGENSTNNGSRLDTMLVGKYAIKIKISDNGYPSCIKNEIFVLYVGDDSLPSQAALVDKLRAYNNAIKSNKNRKNDDSLEFNPLYVNDQDDLETNDNDSGVDLLKLLKNSSRNNGSDSSQPVKSVYALLYSLTNNDYLIIFCLLAALMIVLVLVCLVAFIYLFNKFLLKRRSIRKCSKSSAADMLKVKNYCEKQSSNGSSMNTSQNDDDNQTEINNLLESDSANTNRLSLSLKSTDQSQSADSVVSNVTFAKDTTSSSNSSQAGDNSHHLHHQIYNTTNGNIRQHQPLTHYHHHHGANTASNRYLNGNGTLSNKTNPTSISSASTYDEYTNLIPNSHSFSSSINKTNSRRTLNRDAIYTEPNAQYVKINTNAGSNNSGPYQQKPADGKNLLLLSSFPQKYLNTSNASTLGKQQTLKKQVTYSSTSPASSTTSSTTSSTNMHTPTSSSEGGDLIIVPSPSSDTESLPPQLRSQQQMYHLTSERATLGSTDSRDVHMKYNSIRQYIDLTDDESTACLFISSNETTTVNTAAKAGSANGAGHYLRSSAV